MAQVAIVCPPTTGHINPFAVLGRALVRRGHRVTLFQVPSVRETAAAEGLPYAFAHFSDPTHGEWFGYCDRRGELTNTAKGNNYKGCFHVPRMLLLSYQLLSQAPVQSP